MCERYGIVNCRSLDDMLETCLAFDGHRLPKGPRIGFVTTSGGTVDLLYDYAEAEGATMPDYAPQTLARAVRDSEYDLQYVLYTLALHRWLRFRMGAGYDITKHLGGVRYVFSRGLDRDDASAPGIHALRLPDALLLELDALLRRREAA